MDTMSVTKVFIYLDRLGANMQLLQRLVGNRPLWPVVKANGYGHGLEIVAHYLCGLGCRMLCVATVSEMIRLREAGVTTPLLLLSATLPGHSEAIVMYDCEPVLCGVEMLDALGREAEKRQRPLRVHLLVDTGMGRIGVQPDAVLAFLDRCDAYPALSVCGLMSHFPRAGETDQSFSLAQIKTFRQIVQQVAGRGIELCHMANSAAMFDLPGSFFDAVRPGISIYGLSPSDTIKNPEVQELQPVLEWKTQVTFLKEVPEGVGLSYSHSFHTKRPSLIATVPVGYGDGISRGLSNNVDFLVGGIRCPQVGRITMDQSLVDVTQLRGRVGLGDEVVLIGRQGDEEIRADELAERSGTINYEVVTGISDRINRCVVPQSGGNAAAEDA